MGAGRQKNTVSLLLTTYYTIDFNYYGRSDGFHIYNEYNRVPSCNLKSPIQLNTLKRVFIIFRIIIRIRMVGVVWRWDSDLFDIFYLTFLKCPRRTSTYGFSYSSQYKILLKQVHLSVLNEKKISKTRYCKCRHYMYWER